MGVLRIGTVFTFVLALVSFILTLLCLFAGSSKGFLSEGPMFTLNISQIGQTPVFNTNSNSKDCSGSNLLSLTNDVNCVANAAGNGVNSITSGAAAGLARALNLPDFFDVHVTDFCTGNFDPENYVQQGIANPKKNITFCTKPSTSFNFDPTQVVQSSLPAGVTLADIKWPSAIQKAATVAKLATQLMIILYGVGAGTAGFVVLLSLIGILTGGFGVATIVFFAATAAMLSLVVASATASLVILKAVNTINSNGNAIGISAITGTFFLILTWTATGMMFIATLITYSERRSGLRGSFRYAQDRLGY